MDFPSYIWDMSLWLSVTAIILLISSQLLSQYRGKTNEFINKNRLRNVALTVSALFLITVAIRVYTILNS